MYSQFIKQVHTLYSKTVCKKLYHNYTNTVLQHYQNGTFKLTIVYSLTKIVSLLYQH